MQLSIKSLPLQSMQILDNLSTAVLVFDEDLRVTYINQMAEMLLAVSANHIIGHPPREWMDCDGEAVTDLVRATHVGSPITKRGVVLTTDRNQVTVDCTVSPVIDDVGHRISIVELQHVDRQLRISREDRLIAHQSLTRDVVRGMAHEIKNPLGGLRGAAQLLESELHSDDLREYTRIIIEEADRLQQLVDRLVGPNRRPEYAPLNIHHVLERVRSLVKAETGDRIAIVRDYDPSIPDLAGDADQLIQAVLNIVRNAIRVLGDDGRIVLRSRIQRQMTLGTGRHRLAAQIDIIDNGPGIPEDIVDTLFFPMVTSGTGGMGLGLSIAQSLITQHGGLVECASRVGETIFTIFLPLGDAPGDERRGANAS